MQTSSNDVMVCTAAIEAGRRLGVEPVISAKEMADPDVDHLGVMAYVARLRAAAAANMSKPPRSLAAPSKPTPVSPPPPPPPPPPLPLSPRSPSPVPPVAVNHVPRSDTKLQPASVPATGNPHSPLPPLTRRIRVQPTTTSGNVGQTVSMTPENFLFKVAFTP